MQKKTIEDIRQAVLDTNVTCKSNVYETAKTKMQWVCDKGHSFTQTWDTVHRNIKRYDGKCCPICHGKYKRTPKELKDEFKKRRYTWIGDQKEYAGSSSKLTLKCSNNHIFIASWDEFKQGRRCSECYTNSLGAWYIDEILKRILPKHTKYTREYHVVIDNTNYWFDFYIEAKQPFAIEYDGIQHRKGGNYGWYDNIEDQIKKDRIKDNWAKEHNIPVIRYPDTINKNNIIAIVKKDVSKYTRIIDKNFYL